MTAATRKASYLEAVSRAHKVANLLGVTLPLVGLVAAVALLWNKWLHPVDIALLVSGYLLTGIGVTVGYHRLFTHRAFQTKQWLRWTFAILGSMAVEGPILSWVADHRKHHQFSDSGRRPAQPAHRRAATGSGPRRKISSMRTSAGCSSRKDAPRSASTFRTCSPSAA